MDIHRALLGIGQTNRLIDNFVYGKSMIQECALVVGLHGWRKIYLILTYPPSVADAFEMNDTGIQIIIRVYNKKTHISPKYCQLYAM